MKAVRDELIFSLVLDSRANLTPSCTDQGEFSAGAMRPNKTSTAGYTEFSPPCLISDI